MNQLKIDISFNHNEVVKINSYKILDLNKMIKLNNFFKISLFDVNLDNKNLLEKEKLSIPIYLF